MLPPRARRVVRLPLDPESGLTRVASTVREEAGQGLSSVKNEMDKRLASFSNKLGGARAVNKKINQLEAVADYQGGKIANLMAAVPVSEHDEPRLEPEPQPSTRMCQADVPASCVETRSSSHAAPHRRLDETRRAVPGLVARMAPTIMHT